MTPLPSTLFYATKAERIELARRRYFDEGLPPSGVVSEAVFQSWARCQRLHTRPSAAVVFQPVTTSRTHLALQKNRTLHEAWREELPQLQAALQTTSCAAMLTDASGVIIGASCAGRAHEQLMPVATRIGVNLSEEAVGTTAPGVVVRTGQPVCVEGAEHFFDGVRTMNCAASPIRDVRGRLAGVLDISSESLPFNFDVASVVGLYAGAIENRLLIAQASEHLIVRLQVAPSLLDSPLAGLIGIDAAGHLVWRNAVASRLLGLPPPEPQEVTALAETALGARLSELASLPRSTAAALRLPNGLMVWARAEMRAPDGHRHLTPAWPTVALHLQAAPEPGPAVTETPVLASPERDATLITLRDSDRDLIARALADCGGNVSEAARKLGVSRGLIYRRRQDMAQAAAARESVGCSQSEQPGRPG